MKEPNVDVESYKIQWRIDDKAMDDIVMGRVNKYTMRDLLPGQNISITICATFVKDSFGIAKAPMSCSHSRHASIPAHKGGSFAFPFLFN